MLFTVPGIWTILYKTSIFYLSGTFQITCAAQTKSKGLFENAFVPLLAALQGAGSEKVINLWTSLNFHELPL